MNLLLMARRETVAHDDKDYGRGETNYRVGRGLSEVSGIHVDTALAQVCSPTWVLTLGPGLATRKKTLSWFWKEGNKLTVKGCRVKA